MKKYLVYVMGALYVLAGINHFYNPSFYFLVMPNWLPAHLTLIHISGVAEILLGVGLWFKQTRRISAWLIVAMLIVFIPLHVDMVLHPEKLVDGWVNKTIGYLWEPPFPRIIAMLCARVAVQFVFIYWAWVYTKKDV